MKVQAGMARMLINISSKIAQIARSRPIPFDVPCKRYERELFFVSRRNTHGDMASICELHACTHVTYTNARSERIRLSLKKKEDDERGRERKRKEMKVERQELFKKERERERLNQAESQSNFSNLSNLCRMQNQSRSTLPYHSLGEPSGPHNFQIYP